MPVQLEKKIFDPVLGLGKSRPQCHFQTIQRNNALSTCRSHKHGTSATVRHFFELNELMPKQGAHLLQKCGSEFKVGEAEKSE